MTATSIARPILLRLIHQCPAGIMREELLAVVVDMGISIMAARSSLTRLTDQGEVLARPLQLQGKPLRLWHRDYSDAVALHDYAERERERKLEERKRINPASIAVHRGAGDRLGEPVRRTVTIDGRQVPLTIGPTVQPPPDPPRVFRDLGVGRYL